MSSTHYGYTHYTIVIKHNPANVVFVEPPMHTLIRRVHLAHFNVQVSYVSHVEAIYTRGKSK